MSTRVAVVTGASRGIGVSIVKGLCAKFNGVVYLTARDASRGRAAVTSLNKIGFHPEFHQLDVADKLSVIKFRDFIKEKHGGIDILINNAGILVFDDLYPSYEDAKRVIDVNYRSLLTMEEVLFPLLRDNARVVNVSSDCGHLSNIRNERWLRTLSSKELTVQQLNEFVDSYLEFVRSGTLNKEDFADEGKHAEYRVSQIALTALTMIQQRKYAGRNISVNAVHPGYVQTDGPATKGGGPLTADAAAAAPLYLALEASPALKGTYMWFDKTLVDWYDVEGDYYCKGVW